MNRIPLAQRLGANGATRVFGRFARVSCNDYYLALHGLLGGTDYPEYAKLADGYQMVIWLQCADKLYPELSKESLLYCTLVEPFAEMKKKGERQ